MEIWNGGKGREEEKEELAANRRDMQQKWYKTEVVKETIKVIEK